MTLQEKRTTMLSKVDEWQSSGMPLATFANKKNIPTSTFRYWVSRSRDLSNSNGSIPVTSDFIRFSGDEFLAGMPGQQIKLRYPNGVSLTMPANTSIKDLKKLINF